LENISLLILYIHGTIAAEGLFFHGTGAIIRKRRKEERGRKKKREEEEKEERKREEEGDCF
jgi:hypothetical protein